MTLYHLEQFGVENYVAMVTATKHNYMAAITLIVYVFPLMNEPKLDTVFLLKIRHENNNIALALPNF